MSLEWKDQLEPIQVVVLLLIHVGHTLVFGTYETFQCIKQLILDPPHSFFKRNKVYIVSK